jgi:membrane-associated phospholipid phosphatase
LKNLETTTGEAVAMRLRSQWPLKLCLLLALNLLIYGPYLYLQRHQFFPATTVQPTALDRSLPYWGQSVWIYLSIYLLMPVGPFLMNRRNQLWCYAAGVILIGVVADIVFVFWPTVCPRPDISEPTAAYKILVAIDRPFHAMPSLHAAFAVYSALCGNLVVRALGGRKRWRVALGIWAALILYATLATKQHVFADILAGSVLGFAAYLCVLGGHIFVFKKGLFVQPAIGSVNNPNSAKL